MNQTRREFVRTLFVATQAAVAARLLPGQLFAAEPAAPLSADDFNFLIFGDWGRHGERDQTEVAAQMAATAKAAKARFIISVGDNFYENGVASVDDPQWQTSFENVYHDPALQIPWHVILGNHDYNGNCDAQLEYGHAHPRWNMPARYYSQTHHLINDTTTADFFYLDTSPMIESYRLHPCSPRTSPRRTWKSNSPGSRAPSPHPKPNGKSPSGIIPFIPAGEHGDSGDLVQKILPLLHEYKVQAWF